jgi:hypothetical protein
MVPVGPGFAMGPGASSEFRRRDDDTHNLRIAHSSVEATRC